MSVLPGIAVVIAITLVAGFVAYIGDRVGHQVGRRRLTLFGLRPKYTSTIVAVGTGMLIALTVTIVALVASQLVRTAFFRLGSLNAQINDLQAQAAAMQNDIATTRNETLVLSNGQTIAGVVLTFDKDQSESEQTRALAQFFDETVRIGNQRWTQLGLKPFPLKSTDPTVQAKLQQELTVVRDTATSTGTPVMLMAVADQNLFRGEELHFAVRAWPDKRIARRGDTLAFIDVNGGQPADFNALILAALRETVRRGMPLPFTVPFINNVQGRSIQAELVRLRGRYRVSLRAADDIYPHSGGVALDVAVAPAPAK
jgi:hypothetical protein